MSFIVWATSGPPALLAADRENGQRESSAPALFVLRDRGGERAVEAEASAERIGVGLEQVDVIRDDFTGLARACRGVELGAEEDLLPAPDERFVHLCRELVESEVPEPGVERRRQEQRRRGRQAGKWGLRDDEAFEPLRMIGGDGVGDGMPVSVPYMAKRSWPSEAISSTMSLASVPTS
jgi:hypothetical protein